MRNEAKVLIIGNGFDLAHHLPTSYNDFITFVNILDEFDLDWENKSDWSSVAFKDVFREKLGEGIGFSSEVMISLREHYDVDFLNFDLSRIKSRLENAWLNYFKKVHEIETWIDFEREINHALNMVANYVKQSELRVAKGETFQYITHESNADKNNIFIQRDAARNLHRLNLIQAKDSRANSLKNPEMAHFYQVILTYSKNADEDGMSGVSAEKIVDYLLKELVSFTEFFAMYLKHVVEIISHRVKKNQLFAFENFNDIYSFNYTKTINHFHEENFSVRHLHGSIGNPEGVNIVLGVDEVDASVLGTSALGFTKYFQTIFNNTSFEFLDDEASQANTNSEGTDYFIWGHSLDRSDEKYIKRLFQEISFDLAAEGAISYDITTNEAGRDIRSPLSSITVYYHSQASKASLLKNLLSIIGKEVIEKSIISKHLKFEKSPKIWKEVF